MDRLLGSEASHDGTVNTQPSEIEQIRLEFSQLKRDYSALVDNAPDVLARFDRQGRYLYINNAVERLTGIPAVAFLGKRFHEIAGLPDKNVREWENALASTFETRQPSRIEYDYPMPGHGLGYFECLIHPELGASQEVLSVVAITRDITERRKSEIALLRSEQRYRSLVDATSQIVWTNTAEGRMEGPNADWGGFTGQSEAEYQGFGWAQAVHPDDAAPTILAWTQSVANRAIFIFEHRLRRHDGVYRTFAIRAVPVLESDGSIREWVGVHTDVTERRELEAKQKALADQQAQFVRDVLASVTDGKLCLVDNRENLPQPLPIVEGVVYLTETEGLKALRQQTQLTACRNGFSQEQQYDLITAVSEAGMNAIVHGGGKGTAKVSSDEHGTVQVCIEDHGSGISVENLPRATLRKGFTTAGTLGHGMKMMLQTAHRIYLLTGSTGTTVIIEQMRVLPSTW